VRKLPVPELRVMSKQTKIIQYMPIWAAQKALSSAGTLCLNSLQYYIELEEDSYGVRDNKEMEVDYAEGGGGTYFEVLLVSN
jgi:hypothetical protein